MWLDDGIFRNNRAGGDDAAFADSRVIENHRAHADEAAVADHATVQRHRVADGDPVADEDAVSFFHAVQHAAILNVGIRAHADGVNVATQHGVHPDTGIFAKFHIADDLGRFVHIAASVDAGRDGVVGAEHCSVPSTQYPV